jgi:hypothetical protein
LIFVPVTVVVTAAAVAVAAVVVMVSVSEYITVEGSVDQPSTETSKR